MLIAVSHLFVKDEATAISTYFMDVERRAAFTSSFIPSSSARGQRNRKMLRPLKALTLSLALFAALLASRPGPRAAAAAGGGDDAPAWLRAAASASAPAYPKDVPAVIVNDEETVTVSEDGRVTTVTTCAVRMLTR